MEKRLGLVKSYERSMSRVIDNIDVISGLVVRKALKFRLSNVGRRLYMGLGEMVKIKLWGRNQRFFLPLFFNLTYFLAC